MSANTHKHLLDELQRLLEEQIDSARQGKLGRIETLGEQVGRVIKEIARAGILKRPEYAAQRERLRGLCEDLRLTLSDRRDEAGRELNKIRKGKKTIGAYRRAIQAVR
jgi:hypothetical protein